MNELHLFAGAGGGILAGQLLGRRCICAVESDPYAQAVLIARQNDGTFPPFPIWDDVRTFDGRPWRGIVDIVAGGFPCQDISAAGTGKGIDGERSGLWAEMARIVCEVRPRFVFVENSPMLTSRGLGRVLGDLAAMGFDAEWGVISAADTGAPHLRERIWIRGHLAHADGQPCEQGRSDHAAQVSRGCDTDRSDIVADVANAAREREQRIITGRADAQVGKEPSKRSDRPCGYGFRRWPTEPGMGRVVDGMAHRAHRIRTLGNGQVPRVAVSAWITLGEPVK